MTRGSRADAGPMGLLDPGILIVSGKGGTGKTTVAAAIASVAASTGARVLLTEVEGRGEIARTLGVPEPGYAIHRTPLGFDVMAIAPMEAAYEYLHRYHSLDRLAAPFLRTGGLEQIVRGAPGFRDLLITGKIYELARASAGDLEAIDPVHDLVIVDAPPTGQLAAFLSAPGTFAELIRVGAMRRRSANVAAMLKRHARVLLVAVPEEMAVAETLEAIPAVAATGVVIAGVSMNRVEPAVFPRGTARAGAALRPADMVAAAGAAGLELTTAEATRRLAATRAALGRRSRDRRFVDELSAAGDVFELPDLAFVPPADRVMALAEALDQILLEPPDREAVKLPYRSSFGPTHPSSRKAWDEPVRSATLDGPLATVRIVLVCGSGGVGKTSVSAAIAVHAAASGRRTILLTVDPARRLATALRLPPLTGRRTTIRVAGGRSMDALQLDTKRTFDELVERFATGPDQRDRMLTNRYYRRMADTLGGTHEYMAMEKLHQLAEDDGDRYDLIVVDTPPTRSAMSFLDAPQRLTDFLGGRFVRLMLWPTATAGRLTLSVARFGAKAVLRTVGRLVGAETLADTIEFLAAFEGMSAGFRQRARRVMELLASPECGFVVVAAPTSPSLAEAALFLDRLDADGMRAAAAVVNRVHPPVEPLPPRAAEAAERLSTGGASERAVAAILREADRERMRALMEASEVARFAETHRQVPLAMIPETTDDVHDIPGLRRIAAHLFAARAD